MRVGDGDPRANTRRMQAPPEPSGHRGQGAERSSPNGGTLRRRDARRQGSLAWLGTLSGGHGIAIAAGSTALGALLTILQRHDPGVVLGVFLVLGTIVAGVAVRPSAARLIIPAPTLCYVPAATIAGAINDRAADTSKIGLILHGGRWISSGFVAMALATVFAIVIWGLRLLLDLRTKPRGLGRSPGSRRTSDRKPSAGRELARQDQRRDNTGPYRQRPGDDFDGATRPGVPAGPAAPIGQNGLNGQPPPTGATGQRRPPQDNRPYYPRAPTFTPKPELDAPNGTGTSNDTHPANGTRPSPDVDRRGSGPYPGPAHPRYPQRLSRAQRLPGNSTDRRDGHSTVGMVIALQIVVTIAANRNISVRETSVSSAKTR